jgi:hypothetical protein
MITLTSQQTQIRMIFVSLLLGLILALWPKPSFSQNVASQEQAATVLAIDKVTVQDGTITGEIRNKSKNTVRDVQLFIRYTFLWKMSFSRAKRAQARRFIRRYPGRSLRVDRCLSSSRPRRRYPNVRMADSRRRPFPSLASRKLFPRVGDE